MGPRFRRSGPTAEGIVLALPRHPEPQALPANLVSAPAERECEDWATGVRPASANRSARSPGVQSLTPRAGESACSVSDASASSGFSYLNLLNASLL